MAAATVSISTVLESGLIGGEGYKITATATVSASPATYTAGGIAFNMNNAAIKASRAPFWVNFLPSDGYIFRYVIGADNSAGLVRIYVQDAVAQNPLLQLTDGSAIPAAISTGTLRFEAQWLGML